MNWRHEDKMVFLGDEGLGYVRWDFTDGPSALIGRAHIEDGALVCGPWFNRCEPLERTPEAVVEMLASLPQWRV